MECHNLKTTTRRKRQAILVKLVPWSLPDVIVKTEYLRAVNLVDNLFLEYSADYLCTLTATISVDSIQWAFNEYFMNGLVNM